MEKIKKYFGGISMTWPRVILFAVITAVYTALINQIPFLKETSFQDIAINPECWLLFAVLIVVNCEKWWEASLKCFVFFLISQPLIYLIEVSFSSMGWEIFQYYGYWAKITLLTLPGAVIAFQVKRKDWLSVAVLSVATGFLSWMGVEYLRVATSDFPHHLLSSLFCFALALVLIFALLERKNHLIVSLLVVAAVIIAAVFITGRGRTAETYLGEGSWSYTVEDDSVVRVEIADGNAAVTAKHDGYTVIVFENAEGSTQSFDVTVSGGSVWMSPIDG